MPLVSSGKMCVLLLSSSVAAITDIHYSCAEWHLRDTQCRLEPAPFANPAKAEDVTLVREHTL